MKSTITLGLTVRLAITGLDVRDPIFRYFHEVERSSEHQAAEHWQPLVSKRFERQTKYWATLSFPDLPDIYCLDEAHNSLKGIPLEEALRTSCLPHLTRIEWGHQHFITAIWEGTQVLDFEKSYRRLKEILGEKFPKEPQWGPYDPTPQTLEEIAATLKNPIYQKDPLPL